MRIIHHPQYTIVKFVDNKKLVTERLNEETMQEAIETGLFGWSEDWKMRSFQIRQVWDFAHWFGERLIWVLIIMQNNSEMDMQCTRAANEARNVWND